MREELRLAMNGVVASSLREKGMAYGMIFGVPIPELRRIARRHEPDASLAVEMWAADVRELKLLATMLYPPAEFTLPLAMEWISEVPYPEVAEQLAANLLSVSPAKDGIARLCLSGEATGEYAPACGFLCVANVYIKEEETSPEVESLFLQKAKETLDGGMSFAARSALLALKRYGRRDESSRRRVMELVAGYDRCGNAEREEFFADLSFEFEYYS